jgi:formiminoglutamase
VFGKTDVTLNKNNFMLNINPLFYTQTTAEIWTGRNDGTHPAAQRWHQRIVPLDLLVAELPPLDGNKKGFALIGFACDEGVRRNGGRTGAKEGADSFRKASCNLPVPFQEDLLFLDLGNVTCGNRDMEQAQETLAIIVSGLIKAGYQPLVIGGGHEVAYAHYTGIRDAVEYSETIGIINFDAHFDLREPNENGTNSGTGFLQIANDCQSSGQQFQYMPIGIQKNSNTKLLFDTATNLGVNYITAERLQPFKQQELQQQIESFIARSTHIYLTICLDVFSSSVAPGVSAPAYSGLFPDPFLFSLLETIITSGKVISSDIAELNPSYDQEQRTAKLAAALAFKMIGG